LSLRCSMPEALLAALGADSVPALAFAGTGEASRHFGVRLLNTERWWRDPSVAVARTAYELLAGQPGDDQALLDLVENYWPGHLWVLAVLHSRGHPIQDAWESLGPPLIELPGVPADVRQAIVRTYTPGERQTDPRWLLEAACLGPTTGAGEDELMHQAARALTGAGLRPQAPVSAGRLYGSGEGTYHEVETRAGEVLVSTLGPFFAHEGDPQVNVVALERAAMAAFTTAAPHRRKQRIPPGRARGQRHTRGCHVIDVPVRRQPCARCRSRQKCA
jgi:hypothetical protein